MRKRVIAFVCGVAILILLVACAPSPAPQATEKPVPPTVTAPMPTAAPTVAVPKPTTPPTAAPQAATSAPTKTAGPTAGGTVVEALPATIKNFNPWQTTQNEWKRMNKRILGHLLWLDLDNKMVPDLAEKWDVSADSRVYKFYLRKGVTWHDGKPFTAKDVEFSFTTAAIPAYGSTFLPGAQMIKGADALAKGSSTTLAGVKVIDDYTVEVELDAPNGAFLQNLAFNMNTAPRHVFEGVKPEDVPKQEYCTSKPIGTGPWKVSRVVPDQTIEMVRNESYWNKGAPNIDKYIYKIYTNYSAALAALQSGEVDIAEVQPADLTQVKGARQLKVFENWKGGVQLLFINLKTPAFQDVRVRQAVAYAIDRDGLIAGPFLGLGEPAYHSMSANFLWTWNPKITEYKYDPGKAKQLLKDAGYNTSQRVRFTTYYASAEVEAIAALLQAVGINLDVRKLDAPAWLDSTRKGEWDISYAATLNRPDPEMVRVTWICNGSDNYGSYCNPKVDALLKQGAETADLEKRKTLYQEVDLILNQELPYVPMATVKIAFGYNQRLADFVYERVFWDYAEKWYLTQK